MIRQRGSAPASTYRLQVRAEFDLDAAAAVVPYLRDLGVDWAYLSPILQAASGSAHGYDVVDPTRVDDARGGAAGLARFSTAARAAGLTRLSLETGAWPYFAPARALYARHGFVEGPPFGDYAPDPNSVFMTLDLTAV